MQLIYMVEDNILNGNKITEFCEKIMKIHLSEYNKYKNKINSRFEKITITIVLNGDELKYLTGEKKLRLSSRAAETRLSKVAQVVPYLQDRSFKNTFSKSR